MLFGLLLGLRKLPERKIHSVCLEVLKAGWLIKTHTRHTDSCTHAALADLMQCSAWGSPAVCAWLAGCQWVRWEGLGRDSPPTRMCLPDALLPQVSTAAGSVKLQQSGWIQAHHGKTDWTDQGLHSDIRYVCRLYAQENWLLASVLLFVRSTCELFKVAKGGQTQTSHRQRVGNWSQELLNAKVFGFTFFSFFF